MILFRFFYTYPQAGKKRLPSKKDSLAAAFQMIKSYCWRAACFLPD